MWHVTSSASLVVWRLVTVLSVVMVICSGIMVLRENVSLIVLLLPTLLPPHVFRVLPHVRPVVLPYNVFPVLMAGSK